MMPKPNQNKHIERSNRGEYDTIHSEKLLLDTKPNFWLYSDNFLLKIVVLFLLIFMFAPIMAIVYTLHSQLVSNFHISIDNVMFYAELLLMLLILVVIIKLILDIMDWNYTKYVFTDKRIIIERGFIRKEKIMMSYNKIQDIEIRQSLLERLISVGDIIIYGANEMSETILDDIPSPKNVEEIILTQMNNIGFGNQNTYMNNNFEQQGYQQQYQQPNYPPQSNYNQQPNYQPQSNYNQQPNYQPQNQQNYMDEGYIQPDHYDEYRQDYSQDNYLEDEGFIQPDHNQYDETNNVSVKERWEDNRNNYQSRQLDKEEILRKHDEMFKRHK